MRLREGGQSRMRGMAEAQRIYCTSTRTGMQEASGTLENREGCELLVSVSRMQLGDSTTTQLVLQPGRQVSVDLQVPRVGDPHTILDDALGSKPDGGVMPPVLRLGTRVGVGCLQLDNEGPEEVLMSRNVSRCIIKENPKTNDIPCPASIRYSHVP